MQMMADWAIQLKFPDNPKYTITEEQYNTFKTLCAKKKSTVKEWVEFAEQCNVKIPSKYKSREEKIEWITEIIENRIKKVKGIQSTPIQQHTITNSTTITTTTTTTTTNTTNSNDVNNNTITEEDWNDVMQYL
jgi:hypothetical protein